MSSRGASELLAVINQTVQQRARDEGLVLDIESTPVGTLSLVELLRVRYTLDTEIDHQVKPVSDDELVEMATRAGQAIAVRAAREAPRADMLGIESKVNAMFSLVRRPTVQQLRAAVEPLVAHLSGSVAESQQQHSIDEEVRWRTLPSPLDEEVRGAFVHAQRRVWTDTVEQTQSLVESVGDLFTSLAQSTRRLDARLIKSAILGAVAEWRDVRQNSPVSSATDLVRKISSEVSRRLTTSVDEVIDLRSQVIEAVVHEPWVEQVDRLIVELGVTGSRPALLEGVLRYRYAADIDDPDQPFGQPFEEFALTASGRRTLFGLPGVHISSVDRYLSRSGLLPSRPSRDGIIPAQRPEGPSLQ